MRNRSKTSQAGKPARAHSDEVLDVHRQMIGASAAEGRMIEVRRGRRVHVIEAGDGSPVVFLHGSGTSSLSALSLLEHLEGVRMIAVDRPGYGLSDPVDVPRERFREAAVEFLDETVDELGLESFALAGGSMGGTWALWYALARPERVRRLALLGSAPLLPGTRAPAPLRVMAAPVVADLLPRLVKPSAKMVVRMMSSMGEGETIVRHPDLSRVGGRRAADLPPRDPRGAGHHRCVSSRRRIDPCMRFSRTRLSDVLHRAAFGVARHGRRGRGGRTVPLRSMRPMRSGERWTTAHHP